MRLGKVRVYLRKGGNSLNEGIDEGINGFNGWMDEWLNGRDDDDDGDGDDDFFMRRRRLSPLMCSCPSRAVLGTTIVSSRVIKIAVAGHTSPTVA